jgi:hypothetical protein
MAEANLKQDEIDHILDSLKGADGYDAVGSTLDKANAALAIVKKAKAVYALMERLYFTMATRADLEAVKEARHDLHCEAFGLWCANKGIGKDDYYAIIRRELKRRGLRYVSADCLSGNFYNFA